MIVGYAGTAFRYNVSVFGAPVALAARCSGVKPADPDAVVSSTIVIPAAEWTSSHALATVLPPVDNEDDFPRFALQPARTVELKGLGMTDVREIHNKSLWRPTLSAEDRARKQLTVLRDHGRYWPRSG